MHSGFLSVEVGYTLLTATCSVSGGQWR